MDYERHPPRPSVSFWMYFIYDPCYLKWWLLMAIAAGFLFVIYVMIGFATG